MQIEELSDSVYEDLNGTITSVEWRNHVLHLQYECDFWENLDRRVAFELLCSDVVESTVSPGVCWQLNWTPDDPLLLKHNDPVASLYFSSAPLNGHEVVGRLFVAHEQLFLGCRSFRDHINCPGNTHNVLVEGNGCLATGPVTAMVAYQTAVKDLLRTNVVTGEAREGGFKALIFDEGFIICKQVTVVTSPVARLSDL